jgi:hypothetical protein
MKGLDIGSTYLNRDAAKMFTHFIAEAQRNEMRSTYKTAKFLTILSDGSTDSAVIEQEIVYCRYAVRGKVHTQFLGVQSVPKADASGIAHAIDSVARQRLDINWKDRLVALGTDGAAVMLGKNNGVVAKMKEENPHIISVHCMNHRLELAFKDAAKKTPCHKRLIEELLLGLYLFYHHSSLNRANLRNSFKTLGMPCLVPTRVGGTRWVSHIQRALDHFLRGYKAIVQHLHQVGLHICFTNSY